MRRRLIKQGLSSLTLSLPSKWVKKNSLDAGDEVDISEKGKTLSISPDSSPDSLEIEIDTVLFDQETLPEKHRLNYIKVAVTDAYVQGYDVITLLFNKPDKVKYICNVVKNFLGLAVIEQTNSRVVIKDLSGSKDERIDMLLRRIFLIIVSMAEEGFNLLKKNELENARLIHLSDLAVDQLTCYLMRRISKEGLETQRDTLRVYVTTLLLEQLGDEYERLYKTLEHPLGKEVHKALGSVVKMNRLLYEAYFDFDMKKAAMLERERVKLRDEIPLMASNAGKNDVLVYLRVLKIADIIIDIERGALIDLMKARAR